MTNPNIKAVIFDIDGTLHAEISWYKITEGLGASGKKEAEIFDKYLKHELTYGQAKGEVIKLWQQTGNANRVFMTNLFRTWNLKEDAHIVINHLKTKYQVILISGSIDLYVKTVAEKLGLKYWYANAKLDWDNSGNLTNFHYFRDQALKKMNQFNHLKKRLGLKNENFAVVGDGDTDILLFKHIKFSIMVEKAKAHPELAILAHKKVKQLAELTKIL